MPRVRDLLDRFRPAGAPGSAAGAGVPIDRRAGVEAELEPVFRSLDDVQRTCDQIRRDADASARRCERQAAQRAAAVLAGARAAEPATRSAAAAGELRRAELGVAEIAAEADRQVGAVRHRAEQRLPDLVELVVDRVRVDLAELTTGPPGAAGRALRPSKATES